MVTLKDKILRNCIDRQVLNQQGSSSVESMLELFESAGYKTKNVCVRMNVMQKVELEALLVVTGMSIQEFVFSAIEDAKNQAFSVLLDRGLMPLFDGEFDDLLAAEGLRRVFSDENPGEFSYERIPEGE